MWMLDTDICIALIKRRPPDLIARLQRHKPGDVAISSITLAELSFGVVKSSQPEKNRAALDRFLLPLEVLVFDDATGNCDGYVRATTRSGRYADWSSRHAHCESRIEHQRYHRCQQRSRVLSRAQASRGNWLETAGR